MNAIILSRFDADNIISEYEIFSDSDQYLQLTQGTPGYSWLSVVPDEVLPLLSDSVYLRWEERKSISDHRTADKYEPLGLLILEEMERRKNLKSTKD